MEQLGPQEKMGPYTKIDEIGTGGVKLSVFQHDSGLILFRPEQHYLTGGQWRIGNLFKKYDLIELAALIDIAKTYEVPEGEPLPDIDAMLDKMSPEQLVDLTLRAKDMMNKKIEAEGRRGKRRG